MNAGEIPNMDYVAMLPMKLTPTRYTICALPSDHREWHTFAIHVEWCGGTAWSVKWIGSRLTREGEWAAMVKTYEPQVQFDFETAWELAEEWAAKIEVNGRTASDVLEMEKQR